MGASESILSRQQPQQRTPWANEITTVSEGLRDDADGDPLLLRIQCLTIVQEKLPRPAAVGRRVGGELGGGEKPHRHPRPEAVLLLRLLRQLESKSHVYTFLHVPSRARREGQEN